MYAIELDFGGEYEGDVRDEVPSFVRDAGVVNVVHWSVVNECGPAGGAPIIRFTSDARTAIERIVQAYAPLEGDADPQDQAYLLTLIEELPG